MAYLATFEPEFERIRAAKWCNHPGERALRAILDILRDAKGDLRRLNSGCSRCVFGIMSDTQRLYDAQLAEERAKAAKKKITKKK